MKNPTTSLAALCFLLLVSSCGNDTAASEIEVDKANDAEEKVAEEEQLAAEKAAEEERLAAEKAAEEERLGAEKAAEEERLYDAKISKTKSDLHGISIALAQSMISNGRFPDSLEDLVTPDKNNRVWLKQKTVPKDAWGAEYKYLPPSEGSNDYDLRTLGRDQQPGGEGEDRDITYAMVRNQEI
ncbi:MAG: hypothetical protein CMJ86_07795 [Planctomycetes bacterium]|nr:hypothetical protein [Planctomycetota bacterium]